MTDESEELQSGHRGAVAPSEQFEYDGATFEIRGVSIAGNRRMTGRFAGVVCKDTRPVLLTEKEFDTAVGAIAAAKVLLVAKLSTKPSLLQRLAWPFSFIVKLIFAAGILLFLSVAKPSRRHDRS